MVNTAQPKPQGKKRMPDLEKIKHTGAIAVPSMFTLANMGCGFFAILSASEGAYVRAAWLIIFSYFMDILDGGIARFLHGESPLGIELDSFSDWMSFGIAPAYMAYRMTLKDLGYAGYAIAFFYVLCGLLRLARYNLKAHSGLSSHTIFQGLPIPGASGVIIAIVLNYSMVESLREGPWASMMTSVFSYSPLIVIMLALLMVSNIPFPAFKNGCKSGIKPFIICLALALLVSLIKFPCETIFIAFSGYVIYGVSAALIALFREFFIKKASLFTRK